MDVDLLACLLLLTFLEHGSECGISNNVYIYCAFCTCR